MNIKDIDFNSAADAINNDGSFMTQKHNLWGLYDNDDPDNPIVPYIYKTKEELILWYFDDMSWDINLHSLHRKAIAL